MDTIFIQQFGLFRARISTTPCVLCVLVFLVLLSNADRVVGAEAMPLVVESEPNNKPLDGMVFEAPAMLSGSMPAGDQDAYRWRRSDADAQKLWTLTLTGMPEALTGVSLIQLTLDDAGKKVAAQNTLATFGIRDGSRPVTHRNVLLPAGETIVGMFGAGQSGGGFQPPTMNATPQTDLNDVVSSENEAATAEPSYRLSIEAGEAMSVVNAKPHGTRESALALKLARRYGEIASGTTWYRLDVPHSEQIKRYTINGGIDLSRKLSINLLDADGDSLSATSTDKIGQFLMPNLALKPGEYYLQAIDQYTTEVSTSHAVRMVRWREVGAVTEGEEQEPNPNWAKANYADLSVPLIGKIDKPKDMDVFEFRLDDNQTERPWRLEFFSAELDRIKICLLNEKGRARQCRTGKPPIALDDLVLNTGTHGVSVARSDKIGSYTLQLRPASPRPADAEQEPNDNSVDASLFGKRRILKGTLSKQDKDEFLLLTTEKPQLWRLQAIGENLRDLSYLPQHGRGGQSVRALSDSRRLRLDNLFLLPGQHRFSLTANKDAKYVLRALPLGPPSKHAEREPNSTRNTAHSLTLNQKAVALLTEASDVDFYRWYLAAPQAVRLSLRPAPDAGYSAFLYHDGGSLKHFKINPGVAIEETLWLEPGDYYLRVTSKPASEAEYEVQVDQVAKPALISDREPNDDPNTAAPWPSTWHFQGALGVARSGVDWYRLPEQPSPLILTLPIVKGVRIQLVDAKRKVIAKPQTDEQGTVRITVPPNVESFLYLSGSGKYDFGLQPAGAKPAPKQSDLPLAMQIELGTKSVAAYADAQQVLTGQVKLQNTGAEATRLKMQVQSTDDRWRPSLAQTAITLAAGASMEVPLVVNVDPDVWPDLPVQLRVTALDDNNRIARVELEVQAVRQIVAVAPIPPMPVPKLLRGHINVAAAARGAQWLEEAKKFTDLNDGILGLGTYFRSRRDGPTGPAKDVPIINLAGDKAVQVTGFSLHPFGLQDGQPAQRNARAFAIALSEDGENFITVLQDELSGHTREQFFVLPKPVAARFARLQLLSSKDAQLIALGEWKVLAEPVSVPTAANRNLADPEFGGHVVYMMPPPPNYGHLDPILKGDDKPASIRMRSGYDAQWVIGFHQNRAALIKQIIWRSAQSNYPAFASTQVLVSTSSPLGPWTPVGEWTLDGAGEQVYNLPEPVWARFVKFDVVDTDARTTMGLPDHIRVIEAPDANGSILGEWGYDNPRGPYELQHPVVLSPDASVTSSAPSHRTQENARELVVGKPQSGVVRLSDYDNWYQMTVPENQNTLTLTLAGSPSVRAEAVVLDRTGEAIALHTVESKADRLVLQATAEPGKYWVKVSEPPRSVVFTWDTSGSTAAVRPIIRQAVMNYVQDVKPGLDEAQMLPFGGEFLSRRWLDHPYQLQSVLNDYNGAGNSSAAETALVQAATVLKERRGQRIVVIITDAATNLDTSLWTTLEDVRPRVISVGVSSRGAFSSNPQRERQLMQDWAMVNGGYYEYVENVGATERAFDRASSKIRQPAPYSISLATRFEPDPEPGFLEVVAAEPGDAEAIQLPARTIEIVLDASGSMLQRLDGKRRYQIAKETLSNLVDNELPDTAQFALRVFGHEEPGSCRTDLVMPPKKLDRAAIRKQLSSIVPQNLAKTPIGASLEAVATDLGNIDGEKVVLLITDGEETCEGDAQAAIENLADAGIDAVVNIVGFAVDDPELAATFAHWAKLGGGSYQTAGSEEALSASVEHLTARPFEVLNQKGEVVAAGVSGDEPIELKPGSYRVRLGGETIVDKKVNSSATATITLSDISPSG